MPRHSPARLLAPLALVTVAVALFVIVSNGTGGSEEEASPAPAGRSSQATPAAASGGGTSGRSRGRRTYTVRAGDTPSGIAEKTGVTVERLLELNPDLDPQSVPVGERLKLR